MVSPVGVPTERPASADGRRLAQDATATFAVQVMSYGTGLVASILLARALGPSDRGIYAVAIAAAATAVVLFQAGTELAAAYFFAERGTSLKALTRVSAFAILVLGPLAMLAMLVLFVVADDAVLHGLALPLYLCAVAAVPLQMHQMWLTTLLLLGDRLRVYQRVSAVVAIGQLVAVCVLFATGSLGLTAALTIYLGVAVCAWALCVQGTGGLRSIAPPYDATLFRSILRYGLRLHAGHIGRLVLLRVDLFLVAWWLTPSDAGVYAIAVVFAELAWQLTTPLVLAVTRPQMALPTADAAAVSFRVARFNLLLASFLAVAFAATLWLAIPLLYGHAFAGAYVATVLLLPGVAALAMFRPLYNWLVRVAAPLRLSSLCVFVAVVNVAINAVLLRPLGIAGASLASTVSYLLLAGGTAYWASRRSGVGLRELVPTLRDARSVMRNLGLVFSEVRRAALRTRG